MLGNYRRIQPPGFWPLYPFFAALWHLRNGKCDGGITLVWWFPVREKIQSNYVKTSESFSSTKLQHLSWWIAWGPQPGRSWNIKPGSVCFHRRQPWALDGNNEEVTQSTKMKLVLQRRKQGLFEKANVSVDQSEACSASSPGWQGCLWWDRYPWSVTLGHRGHSQEDSEKL